MRKMLGFLLILSFTQLTYANSGINIKISGAAPDNRYFLCLPNLGCLSIKAAENGKYYPITATPFEVNQLYVSNMDNLGVYPQSMPSSCQVTINDNQTLEIHGQLVSGANDRVAISNLSCSLS